MTGNYPSHIPPPDWDRMDREMSDDYDSEYDPIENDEPRKKPRLN